MQSRVGPGLIVIRVSFFEQDDNTTIIAQHCEDLKDGRAFAEVAERVSKKKPVVMLKAGRTSQGARAASSHTGALAGNDKIYDDVLRQSGVIRARSQRYLMANVPRNALAHVREVLPGLNGPTVIEIAESSQYVAVHAVVSAATIYRTISQLRALGGEGILVTRIERLVP